MVGPGRTGGMGPQVRAGLADAAATPGRGGLRGRGATEGLPGRRVGSDSLAVRKGDFAALLGASGSGKSTLMNLIAGLDRPDSGSIVVEGQNLAQLSQLYRIAAFLSVAIIAIVASFAYQRFLGPITRQEPPAA